MSALLSDFPAALSGIPRAPGVYRFVDDGGQALYVGKAGDLRARVASYFHQSRGASKTAMMLARAKAVDTTVTASEDEALLLENDLIKSLRPKFNILFRDDKSYPYLRFTGHAYPRVMFYRRAASGATQKDADEDVFGPFPDSGAVRESIRLLQKAFGLRTCADAVFGNRARPCLLHQIGRCSAPCVNYISPGAYRADANRAKRFLRGGADAVTAELAARMEDASRRTAFEEAARLRDNLRALAAVRIRYVDGGDAADFIAVAVGGDSQTPAACVRLASVRGGRRVIEKDFFPANAAGESAEEVALAFVAQHYGAHPPPPLVVFAPGLRLSIDAIRRACPRDARFETAPRGARRKRAEMAAKNAILALRLARANAAGDAAQFAALASRLQLGANAQRAECFDVSHTMGEETVAACVVCDGGAMRPSQYRRFTIRAAIAGDDGGALYEAVLRRYKRVVAEDAPRPDLILIDGGAMQLKAAQAALGEVGMQCPLLALAKGRARKSGDETLISGDGEVMRWPAADAAFLLARKIRDEAHRFAIAGHRRRREKKRRISALEQVEGIGPRRRRELLARFGSLRGVRTADADELAKIGGIGGALAQRVLEALR